MVTGATLLLAALVSTPPRAPLSTYEQTVCDAGEAVVDADDLQPPIAVAGEIRGEIVNAQCAEPLPPVVDCNAAPMSIWVREMIGSCDMPRGDTAMKVPHQDRPSATCDGNGCSRDRVPLKAVTRSVDPSQSLATVALDLAFYLSTSRITSTDSARPRSALAARLERPPRA